MPITSVSVVLPSIILAYVLWRYWNQKTRPPYPPGPKGLPLIGNLSIFPRKHFALTYLRWGKQFGPLTWATVPGRKFLILNNYDDMRALLDKRGYKYIDRPAGVMVSKLMKTDFTTPRLPGNERWKRHRKLLRQALSQDAVRKNYSELFILKASEYCQGIRRNPENFWAGLKRVLGETISELTLGALTHSDGTDYVTKHEENFEYTKRVAMGYLVDLIPILRFVPTWFPGAEFRRDAKRWGKHCADMRKMMIEGVEQRMASKEGRPCYVSDLLTELLQSKNELGINIDEDVQAVHDTGFSFYQAGSDTTEILLKNFLLAMIHFPEAQAKARAEVDMVFGLGHSPNYEAQDQMPYIHAVILECMRWSPPVPAAVPHTLRDDDIYEGYFIPKGTVVIPNVWSICRDPKIYPDPSTFNPDRFIDNPDLLDPRDYIFGFGRRICPGNYMAYHLAWIFVVSLLWNFELRSVDGDTLPTRDEDRFELGSVSYPFRFRCNFVDRRSA